MCVCEGASETGCVHGWGREEGTRKEYDVRGGMKRMKPCVLHGTNTHTQVLTSGLDMKEMARPLVPNLPARPTLCKYWSLCSTLRCSRIGYSEVQEGWRDI